MKRILTTLLGILAVLIGLGLIMPAATQWRTLGILPGPSVALLALGVLLTVGGMSTTACGFRKPKT